MLQSWKDITAILSILRFCKIAFVTWEHKWPRATSCWSYFEMVTIQLAVKLCWNTHRILQNKTRQSRLAQVWKSTREVNVLNVFSQIPTISATFATHSAFVPVWTWFLKSSKCVGAIPHLLHTLSIPVFSSEWNFLMWLLHSLGNFNCFLHERQVKRAFMWTLKLLSVLCTSMCSPLDVLVWKPKHSCRRATPFEGWWHLHALLSCAAQGQDETWWSNRTENKDIGGSSGSNIGHLDPPCPLPP